MVEPLTNAVLLVGQSRQVRAFHELPDIAHAIAAEQRKVMALWVRVAGRRTSCTEDMPVFCEMCFTPGGIGGQSAAGAASVCSRGGFGNAKFSDY
jgi:hypothetical protein